MHPSDSCLVEPGRLWLSPQALSHHQHRPGDIENSQSPLALYCLQNNGWGWKEHNPYSWKEHNPYGDSSRYKKPKTLLL